MATLRPTITRPKFTEYNYKRHHDEFSLNFDHRQPTPKKFVPVAHPDLYYRDLELHGMDSTRLRKLHEENPVPVDVPIQTKPPLNIPEFADFIPTELHVKKNGAVKVQMHTKMAELYEKYKQGKKPSIEERVLACKDFGYPDEVLKSMIVKHEKRLANVPALEAFILGVFGEMSDKKSSAPKKKNLYQIFKIKKTIFALPEPEEEEPNEDADVPDEEDNLVV